MHSILITGGAGFIGTNFIQTLMALKPDYQIVNLDALTYAGGGGNLKSFEKFSNVSFVEGFVEDLELLGALFVHYQFDTVVHFAAETHVDRSIIEPALFIRSNIQGTYAVLEAARSHWREDVAGKRVHLVSTDEVYGSLSPAAAASKETDAYAPRSPYAASKASGDHLGMSYFYTYGLPVSISHGANTFGPYQHPEKLVPLVILKCLQKEPIPIYGDGEQIREWLYVQDHCEAIAQIIATGIAGESYNIGGKLALNNLVLVQQICDLMDVRLRREQACRELIQFVADRPGHDRRYTLDAAKMEKELNWKPKITLEQGLEKTIDWYLSHEDWLTAIAQGIGFQAWQRQQYQNR